MVEIKHTLWTWWPHCLLLQPRQHLHDQAPYLHGCGASLCHTPIGLVSFHAYVPSRKLTPLWVTFRATSFDLRSVLFAALTATATDFPDPFKTWTSDILIVGYYKREKSSWGLVRPRSVSIYQSTGNSFIYAKSPQIRCTLFILNPHPHFFFFQN